jgi:hypothetical protein
MFRAGLLVASCLSVGCATAPPRPDSWASAKAPNLVELVNKLAGPEAIDCGFINQLGEEESHAGWRAAMRCASAALEHGEPFKFGTYRIPMDSYTHEIVVRGADGQLWFLVLDVMLDGDAPQFWQERCTSVTPDAASFTFLASGCTLTADAHP